MILHGFGASAALLSSASHPAAKEHITSSEVAEPGRALVPLQPINVWRYCSTPTRRPGAAFLAHLIAAEQQNPQTRHRRRAAPLEAADAYQQMLTRKTTATGRRLSRVM